MPALTAIYGLRWDDVWRMPGGELREYLDQLEDFMKMHAGAMGADEEAQGSGKTPPRHLHPSGRGKR